MKRIPQLYSRDWLRAAYKRKSTLEIATELRCAPTSVDRARRKFKIPIPTRIQIPELHNPRWLRQQYATKNSVQIAAELGCSDRTVREQLEKYQIPRRPRGIIYFQYLRNPRWVRQQYAKKSARQIADEIGCTPPTVQAALKRYGIPVRFSGGRPKIAKLWDKEWLQRQYAKFTLAELSARLRCTMQTIQNALKRFQIPARKRRRNPRPMLKSDYQHHIGPDGRSYPVHRLIMEAHLGRKLRSDEVVHHIDHNPRNNTPGNLRVMTKHDHSSLHGKLAWQSLTKLGLCNYPHQCLKCHHLFLGGPNGKWCPFCRPQVYREQKAQSKKLRQQKLLLRSPADNQLSAH